ncbi:thiopeptide-type bacteriocin biosynthesis protein [Streptomyces sp. ZAF1911]|uniref:thiopeptide-type bacteriocin biosynthesis protein n=1 Tax=Streptomyces sp. ZAF1911 TaxID=2944129 RepID=UPI00237B155B|nr:thiopeptide-type bacteriocin biosynthesis protein [Streptomyces sp. ZAF1911]MDD9375795.1 thiopeptide-type bacteriocin biosynthesis protein [Streptomyces sp. ZAF1911]
MSGDEWLYARLHHTTHGEADRLLAGVVSDWVSAARAAGVRRWFFIRYADPSGPHLRLRFQGSPEVLDACYAAGRELWAAAVQEPPAATGSVERLHPLAERLMPSKGRRRLSFGLYGREHHYYGDPAAVRIAEELFELSSEFALAAIGEGPDRTRLARLATGVMDSCLAEALGPRQRDRFRQAHWRYWTGPPLTADAVRLAEAAVSRWRPALAAAPEPDRSLGPAAANLGRALADGVARAVRADPSAVAARVLLMQVHMTFNRLGFLPLEEAVLGRAAALPDGAEHATAE